MNFSISNSPVRTLAGSNILAQLILLAASVAVARLYDPLQFGLYSSLLAASLFAGAFVSLRWEFSLPLADPGDRQALLRLSTMSALILGPLFAIVVSLVTSRTPAWMTVASVAVLAVGVSLFQTYSQWGIVNGQFGFVSAARVVQASVLLVAQSVLASAATVGLVVGHALGYAAALVLFALGRRSVGFQRARFENLRRVARRYGRSACWSSVSSGINALGSQGPVLILALVSLPAAGAFAVGYRLVMGPVLAVGVSASQVVVSRIASAASRDEVRAYVIQLHRRLLVGAAVCAIPLVTMGPWFADSILGSEWKEAGEFMQVLAPSFLIAAASSASSLLPVALGHARGEASFQALLTAIRACSMIVLLPMGPKAMVFAFSCTSAIMWTMHMAWSLRLVGGSMQQLVRRCGVSLVLGMPASVVFACLAVRSSEIGVNAAWTSAGILVLLPALKRSFS